MDFKVGDEVWWFTLKKHTDPSHLYGMSTTVSPGDIELVHDQIKEIKDDYLQCWHCCKKKSEIWGKTRFEAWSKLKDELEKWGALDGTN